MSKVQRANHRIRGKPDSSGSGSSSVFDEELKNILEKLAEGLFPLAQWIEDKISRNGYQPAGDLPWRMPGRSLTPAMLGVISFFEELLRKSSEHAPLVARWRELAASDPVGASPISGLHEWRQRRPHLQTATFGVAESDNVLIDADMQPTWREEFYRPYWSLLKATIHAADPQTQEDWQTLAAELFAGTAKHWPVAEPSSAAFVHRLARDLLYAMLGMRNPAPEPWQRAVLIELGEHRRVGNSFTLADVEGFVTAFLAKLPGGRDGH
jgi:hypothetical protein